VRRPPPIDPRTPEQIADRTRALLRHYLADYGWDANSDGGEAGKALVGVFAHYCGLLIERINRAPEKNLLAFLDLLGNSLAPPIPAEAPLTFFLDGSATQGRAVPIGTRVQADPAATGGIPVLFETIEDLWLSGFELKCLGKQRPSEQTPRDIGDLIMTQPVEDTLARLQGPGSVTDQPVFDGDEALIFGLFLPPGRNLEPGRPLRLYVLIDDLVYDPSTSTPPEPGPVRWEHYRTGTTSPDPQWTALAVTDGTDGLTRSGPIDFLVPADMTAIPWIDPNLACRWLRASATGRSGHPLLRGVALNTVLARHTVTTRDEVLGSSNGNAGQRFGSRHRPILEGERLEIRERPAIGATADPTDWAPWTQVRDFYDSGPSDRHYVVDRQGGEVRFGDGRRGMIPPPGIRNLRLAEYRSGGGLVGNVPAGAIKTLVAEGRFIERVTNFLPAVGGADGEPQESLLERAPKALRHRDRAVTAEDFEDLARLASPQIARALCVPLLDLTKKPASRPPDRGSEEEVAGAGWVSVIVVPFGSESAPLPDRVLLRQVEDHLRRHGTPGAHISVTGPLYLTIDVTLGIALESPSAQVRVTDALQALLSGFLHPLTGRGGSGWPFGRVPQPSDIHALIATAKIPGVAALDSVDIKLNVSDGTRPVDCAVDCVKATGRFLVCSGTHSFLTS